MFFHELPNGNIIRSDNLPRELAIKRMIDEERWCKEHREELEVSSQQLFDDMFGGWWKQQLQLIQFKLQNQMDLRLF